MKKIQKNEDGEIVNYYEYTVNLKDVRKFELKIDTSRDGIKNIKIEGISRPKDYNNPYSDLVSEVKVICNIMEDKYNYRMSKFVSRYYTNEIYITLIDKGIIRVNVLCDDSDAVLTYYLDSIYGIHIWLSEYNIKVEDKMSTPNKFINFLEKYNE